MAENFKVGDKVRVLNGDFSLHKNGDEGEIVSLTPFMGEVMHDVDSNGIIQGHYRWELELVEEAL